MLDLTDPSGMLRGAAPAARSTSPSASTSTTSPTRVDVPWPSISDAVAGDSPALCQARSTASRWPIGLGAVIPLPRPSLAPPTPRTTA